LTTPPGGGTFYDDSGGPLFLGSSSVVVGITIAGDRWCRATDETYRADTAAVRNILKSYVTLP
jgi:hypothetical protein